MLSRLWYIVLAALFATALMATMLAQNAYNRSFATRLSDDLVRDRTELELWLRLEARTRLDAIAPLAANGDVRAALAAATDRRDRTVVDAPLRAGLERQLTRLNDALQEGKADILFAVDLQGQIIGQVGGTAPPPQASLEADYRRELGARFGVEFSNLLTLANKLEQAEMVRHHFGYFLMHAKAVCPYDARPRHFQEALDRAEKFLKQP